MIDSTVSRALTRHSCQQQSQSWWWWAKDTAGRIGHSGSSHAQALHYSCVPSNPGGAGSRLYRCEGTRHTAREIPAGWPARSLLMLAAPSGLSPSACGGCPAAAGLHRAADRPTVCDLAEPWRCKLLDLERDAGLRRAASGAAGCCSAANGLICMSLGMRARANMTWLLYCTGFRPARLRRLIQAGNISRIACAHAHLKPHGRAGADDKHSSLPPCSQPAGIGHRA